MNYFKNSNTGKLLIYIGIPVLLLAVLLRFVLFYFKSDGLSGFSILPLLLAVGIFVFTLSMSSFFAAWVYQDCKNRKDDGILWAVIVFVTTPFIGLLVYFLRRSEVKKNCLSCGHMVSLKAKYCEQCGSKIENKEETEMELQHTHHMKFIVMGSVCTVLMLACLISFIAVAASGKGINTDITSSEKIWNIGGISMNYQSYIHGIWKLDFRSASDGFAAEKNMSIHNSDNDCLYADISCQTIPDGSSLTLYLVQGDIVKSFDVTNLSEPLKYPLTEFENGQIHVRLLINGVENTTAEIYIQ